MAPRPKTGREDTVCVAQIGAAHGLKGEVRLFSFTQEPSDVGTFGPLTIQDRAQQLLLVSLRPAGDHFVARFEGVDDRNAAELLRNKELYVARDKLPTTDDAETYYYADLVGLTATYRNGVRAGEIVAVHNFGAGDLLEVRMDQRPDTVLFPFTAQTVPKVDIAAQQIVIDPPEEVADEAEDSASQNAARQRASQDP